MLRLIFACFLVTFAGASVACSVNEVPPTTPADGGSDARVDAAVDAGLDASDGAPPSKPCHFDDDASRFDNCVFQ